MSQPNSGGLARIQAAPIDRNAELSVIGVDTTGSPSLSTFPKTFSSDGFKVWKKIFEPDSKWFADVRKKHTDASNLWFAVIQHYLSLCSKNGIFPFNKANQQTQNEVVTSFLASSRRKIVKFVDDQKFFKQVKVYTVSREYIFKPTSFTLIVTANLRPIQDPTFVSWLTSVHGPRFIRGTKPGRYEKHVQSNVDMFMDLANMAQPKIGFKIFCHTPVAVPEYSKLPTKSKLTSVAERSIWLPIVRANRFKDAGSRLF